MPQTYTIDDVPATLAAWDRAMPGRDRMLTLARRQREEDEAHEAEMAAEERRLAEAMEDALSEGDVRAPAFFAVSRRNPNKALPLFEVFYGALQTDALRAEQLQLLVDAALGMDVRDRANKFLRAVSAQFGRDEAGLVVGSGE